MQRKALQDWFNKSVRNIFPMPGWCYQCERFLRDGSHPYLCRICKDSLPTWKSGNCTRCGHYHRKGDCEEDWSLELESYRALFYYKEPLHSWISRFKYGPNLLAGRVLRELLREYYYLKPHLFDEVDLILPIPSHPKKLKSRGFNSASFLLDFPEVQGKITGGLKKQIHTEPQAGLDKQKRLQNLANAFVADREAIEGKRILLFDDVCTTGRTFEVVTHCLKQAGAEKVSALSICRALGKGN